jgi:hypothetical protein
MRRDQDGQMKITLTDRDLNLISLLDRAHWLTTRQIHQCFFPNASANACQKRLRILASGGFLVQVRSNRTDQSVWRIGIPGLARLQKEGIASNTVPKRVPGNLDHFSTINDVRLWFLRNLCGPEFHLKYYLAEWELKTNRQLKVIPDALAVVSGHHDILVAVEVDLGTENASFFQRSKIENYRQFRNGDQDFHVLVLVNSRSRLKLLLRHLYGRTEADRFVVAELSHFLDGSVDSPSLISLADRSDGAVCMSLLQLMGSPHCLSSRQERPVQVIP